MGLLHFLPKAIEYQTLIVYNSPSDVTRQTIVRIKKKQFFLETHMNIRSHFFTLTFLTLSTASLGAMQESMMEIDQQHQEFYTDLRNALDEHRENSSSLYHKIQNLLDFYDNDSAFVTLLPKCLQDLGLTFEGIKDPMKMTAIHLAACKGSARFIRLLFIAIGDGAHSLSRCQSPDGKTALHYAVDHNQIRVAKLLVSGNQEEALQLIRITENNGQTALHLAIRWGCTEIVKILLSVPMTQDEVSDLIAITNNDGMNSLELAENCLVKAFPENKYKYQAIIDTLNSVLNT